MSCHYTAQGYFFCTSDTKAVAPGKETFIVNDIPNEGDPTAWCAPVNKAFLDIAKHYKCDISANMSECKFNFTCSKTTNN
jgi:hypothetical protein